MPVQFSGLKILTSLITERDGRTREYWLEVACTVQKRQWVNIPQYGSSSKTKKHTAYDKMAKSRPRKNQSESLDLPQDYLATQ